MSGRLSARERRSLRWFREQWEPLGYAATKGSSGHYRVTDPEGRYVASISSSPTNSRSAEHQTGRMLRRHEEQRQKAARGDAR